MKKHVGTHDVYYLYAYYFCLCTFLPCHPYLVFQFQLFFLLVSANFLSLRMRTGVR